MEGKNEIKESDIKNCTCCYFNGIIKNEDFDISIGEKSYENILVHNISYKSLIDSKSLNIRLDKIDDFIRVYDGIRYLVLFGNEKYDFLYNRIRYLVSVKNDITYTISQN